MKQIVLAMMLGLFCLGLAACIDRGDGDRRGGYEAWGGDGRDSQFDPYDHGRFGTHRHAWQ